MKSLSKIVLARALVTCLAASALVGCGTGAAGNAVRPKETTAAEGLGEGACREADSSGEPLVVDWKPEQRGDLELVMKENVAVVSYSCKGIKLLKECKVDGKYGFLGMSKKEQVVRLTSADEVKANLPLGGASIAGSLAGGSTLDVAMVMVGKVKTTWAKVSADELQGDCAGATHFVKGAMVGAFVMETGTKGEVKTAAQMFGAGASGQSSSEKNVKNKDGDVADCSKASPDDKKAPGQCQAFIRLELKAIAPKATEAKPTEAKPEAPKAPEVAAVETGCPKGLVMTEGKCADPKSAAAYTCSGKDVAECQEQCQKGSTASCGAAGALVASGTGGATRDDAKARELLGKGCDGGDTKSCSNLGVMLAQGRGGAKDAAGAAKKLEKGCADADALACGTLGMLTKAGEGVSKDEAKAAQLLTKACEGGHDLACATAGKMLVDGAGTAKDVTKGADFLKRACDGSQGQACVDLGLLIEAGKDVPKNPILAKLLFQRGCFRGNEKACFAQGRAELGQGGNADMAKRAFDMGCMRNDTLSCSAMKVLYGGTRPVFPTPDTMDLTTKCNSGSARDCGLAGLVGTATNNPMAKSQIERACMQQDPLACAIKNKKP